MKQLKYDIMVIGSGLGGLTSAALLSKAGYKTLVAEKLPFTGGRCASLDYDGYKLPLGVGLVEDEIHGELCREVGAEFELTPTDYMYCYRIRGKDYHAPAPGVLKTMIREASQDDAVAKRVYEAYKRSLIWESPSCSISLHDWLKQYTDNPFTLGIFKCTCGIMSGMHFSNMPAGEYFSMLKQMAFARTTGFLPRGGSSLVDALVQVIETRGGEVWTHSPTLKINIKDEVATGVVIRKDNEEIEVIAQAVISNAGPWLTVDLVGRENLCPGYLRDVDAVKSVPGIVIYAGSDRPFVEGHSYLTVPGFSRLCAVDNYSNTSFPEMAPKGKYLVVALAFPASLEPPYDFKEETELVIQELKDTISDFDKHAQILQIMTYHRGWGVLQSRAGYSLPIKTPIERLYSVGDAFAPSGWLGSAASVKSGRLVVEDITNRFKPA